MSHAIEQLIKLHDAQAVSIESFGAGRGRGVLSKDQVIAAFSEAERRCSIGFDLLMAKHRQDARAEMRLRNAIHQRAQITGHELATAAADIAISLTLNRILPSQHNHIASLLRRHHRRGQQARRLIDACNDTIRGMKNRRGDPEYIRMQQERAAEIRTDLKAWSEREAAAATVCPRCNGTANIKIGSCPECKGSGRIASTNDDVWRSMREAGCSKEHFSLTYLPMINALCSWLSKMESEASDIMNKRIRAELRGAA